MEKQSMYSLNAIRGDAQHGTEIERLICKANNIHQDEVKGRRNSQPQYLKGKAAEQEC